MLKVAAVAFALGFGSGMVVTDWWWVDMLNASALDAHRLVENGQ